MTSFILHFNAYSILFMILLLCVGCSIPTKKSTPVTSVEALLNNVDSWLFDDSGADECSEWLDKKDSLTTQLAQAEAGCDFMAISVLGKKLQAHTAAAAQLAVSEEKYYSLPTQRAQLLVELKRECFERIQAQNFDIVIHLSAALDAIQKTDDRYPPPVPTLPAAPADAPILCIIQEPAEAVTLSLLQVHKQAPAGDHTSPTSVVAVPSEDPTPWDPCCNTPPRMLVPPTGICSAFCVYSCLFVFIRVYSFADFYLLSTNVY